MQHLSPIITALGVIIMGWWKVTQKDRDLKADRKHADELKKQELKYQRRNDHSMIVYNTLHNIRVTLDADRVYIVQPHPLGNESLLTIYYEVRRPGVESMREAVTELPMSEVPDFCGQLHDNLFLRISDIDKQVSDPYAKSLLATHGTEQVFIKRLSDSRHDWVGSIFAEYSHDPEISDEEAKEEMHRAALTIQYILPEIV